MYCVANEQPIFTIMVWIQEKVQTQICGGGQPMDHDVLNFRLIVSGLLLVEREWWKAKVVVKWWFFHLLQPCLPWYKSRAGTQTVSNCSVPLPMVALARVSIWMKDSFSSLIVSDGGGSFRSFHTQLEITSMLSPSPWLLSCCFSSCWCFSLRMCVT